MADLRSQFTLRLKVEVQAKMQYLANKENRSLTNMIEWTVIEKIKAYEAENGEIILTDEDIYLK